ncbi:NAD-dependent epimerase/dehydratase family protein [Agromyces sp. ZXT2-6]|uniref:NAD-dependent epimerase/dehydratase family protein n=1 Tax=Agromyces sp. ZXT2-6 TaxID=3461153 RepID=UPI004054C752
MRIVIVGATGNVGSATLRRLHGSGHQLVGVARRRPDTRTAPYTGVEWHEVDVSQATAPARLARIFTGADAVLHLAWVLQPNRREPVMRATNLGGHRHALAAAAEAGVTHVVVVTSVASYSPGPKSTRVDEDWPTGGVHTSHYSRHKAATERMLDAFEADHPQVRLTRVRPGFVFQRDASSQLARLFIGRRRPSRWLGRVHLPVLPVPRRVISQAVHADDLADALARIIEQRADGAFNIAAEPVIDPDRLRRAFRARRVIPVRFELARAAMWSSWALGLQASDPGWLDIAVNVPVMSTRRARVELGWAPRHWSTDALREVLEGIAEGAHVTASPPLSPSSPPSVR